MTMDKSSKKPVFVAVHSKIARGAFANWLIMNRIDATQKLINFSDLGYKYNAKLSTDNNPLFICDDFLGLGLSIRLK